MLFMNEWEINENVERHRQHPVLGPATRFLAAYRDEVNSHSDGWPYWSAPVHAANKLMTLIQQQTGSYVTQGRPLVNPPTKADVLKALTPIKAFMTRKGNAAGMKLPPLFDTPTVPEKTMADLQAEAMRLADIVATQINERVPTSVTDMPYAKQYVLEEVVKLLTARI